MEVIRESVTVATAHKKLKMEMIRCISETMLSYVYYYKISVFLNIRIITNSGIFGHP